MRNVYKMLIGKPKRNNPLERPNSGRKSIVVMEPPKIRCETLERINAAQDIIQTQPLLITAISLRATRKAETVFSNRETHILVSQESTLWSELSLSVVAKFKATKLNK